MTRRSRTRSTDTRCSESGPLVPRRRRRAAAARLVPAALACALVAGLTGARAEDAGRHESLATAYDREIEALQKELDGLSGEQETVNHDVEALSIHEAVSRRQFEKASWGRDAAAREAARLTRECAELEKGAASARERARAALRETYKQGGGTGYASLLSVEGPADLMRGLQSLDVLSRRQSDAVVDYSRRRREAADGAARLKLEQAALSRSAEEARAESDRLHEARAARLVLLDRLQKDRTLQTSALQELQRAMLALNDSIASLPQGSSPGAGAVSFSRLEGGLPWPARGAITVSFGSIRNPRFGTVTPHPGIEIRVEPGAPVRSVGVGRVVFDRRYGSYGRTVVVDHGERYLSVYAHLAASTVVEGAEVAPGQQIGFAGEGDARDKSFVYFEIRHQGKAIDPAGWLRRSRAESGGTP
ncbi:MAG: peptidoglycan DD-metalloendopeptidase family protein [Acidobacteria bacterium]|nr:peptidoglycan DD-metalloendopeptidase family protein [Acidobacteriota bacterium]